MGVNIHSFEVRLENIGNVHNFLLKIISVGIGDDSKYNTFLIQIVIIPPHPRFMVYHCGFVNGYIR